MGSAKSQENRGSAEVPISPVHLLGSTIERPFHALCHTAACGGIDFRWDHPSLGGNTKREKTMERTKAELDRIGAGKFFAREYMLEDLGWLAARLLGKDGVGRGGRFEVAGNFGRATVR